MKWHRPPPIFYIQSDPNYQRTLLKTQIELDSFNDCGECIYDYCMSSSYIILKENNGIYVHDSKYNII